MKKKEIIEYALLILAIILIRTFVVTPIRVNGDSMLDKLEDGDLMILKKYDKSIERFDIVVIDHNGEKIIKRVIGLPEEEVKYDNNVLYINGEVVEDNYSKFGWTKNFYDYCAKDEYFVLGDNRNNSVDSRKLGCIDKKEILGTTDFIFFPFNKFGITK